MLLTFYPIIYYSDIPPIMIEIEKYERTYETPLNIARNDMQ